MRRLAVAGLVAALVAAAGCGPPGQSRRAEAVPVETLPMAIDTITVPWNALPEAEALGQHRWVVVGADHDAAVVVDFSTGATVPLGGRGGEALAKPFGVYAIGDTAWVADWAKSRLTAWLPDGRLVDSVTAPGALRGVLPRARDRAGQYYFEIPPIAGPDGAGLKDSAAVVRGNPALTQFDTVARLAPLDVAEVKEARGHRFERLVFSGNDWWGVLPDGRIWIARVRRNEVSILEGRKERRGDRLPDPVLEVTRADREQYVNSFPEELRAMADQLQFSPFKPAFERGFDGAGGTIWLRKSKAALDSVRRYQVVDSAGVLQRVFSLGGRGIVVAADPAAVLVAEIVPAGVYLMEIPLPPPPAPTPPAPR
ncbi:MAG: hypothetical protein AB7L66_08925 [Gemmatimonadales bacterium]